MFIRDEIASFKLYPVIKIIPASVINLKTEAGRPLIRHTEMGRMIMGNIGDFEIEDGVLEIYRGYGRDVTIPEGVTRIGEYAFLNCWSLTSVIIPEGVTSIGRSAFYNCKNLTSVIIPEGVVRIEESAFVCCDSLTSVIIPEGVTSIGESAFYNCESLTSIIIPESVTSIGKSAFYNCESLTSITIPESATSIGEEAFTGCKGLADQNGFVVIRGVLYDYFGPGGDVTIPEGVTSIGEKAFKGCKGLADQDGFVIVRGVLYDYLGPGGDVTIPGGVTSIGKYAFVRFESLTSITIPESVKSMKGVRIIDGSSKEIIYTSNVVYGKKTVEGLKLIYLGGGISRIPSEYRMAAARGFIYARGNGITEILKWEKGYLSYLRSKRRQFVTLAGTDRTVLLFLIRESILTIEDTRYLMEQYGGSDDIEAKAALLDYYNDKFGADGLGDISL